MNVRKLIYYTLMFLPLVITLVVLPSLPEKIPAHYGYDNQVTRWGSKYETLILPAVTVLLGYFLLIVAKLSSKQKEEGKNNEDVVITTGIAVLILFTAMTCYFLYTAFNRVENLSSVSLDIYQFLFAILGASMIIIGTMMPRLSMNLISGLRTPWSLKNEAAWEKSQRFGGISFIAAGIVIIIICLFVRGWQCFAWTTGILLATVVVDVIYTYRISKNL